MKSSTQHKHQKTQRVPKRAVHTARKPHAKKASPIKMQPRRFMSESAPVAPVETPIDTQSEQTQQIEEPKKVQFRPFVDLPPGRRGGQISTWKRSHGFIIDDETSQSLFFHITSVPLKGYISFTRGQKVEFEQGTFQDRPVAVNVLPLVQQFDKQHEIPIAPKVDAEQAASSV